MAAEEKKKADTKRAFEEEKLYLADKEKAREALNARAMKEEKDAQKKKDDREFEEKELEASLILMQAKLKKLQDDINKEKESATRLSQVSSQVEPLQAALWVAQGEAGNPIEVDLPDVWAPVMEEVTGFVESMLEDNRKLGWMENLQDKPEMMVEIVQVMTKYALPEGPS